MVILMMTVTGCLNGVSNNALEVALDKPMTKHASALAGDDVALMRSTGRDLIATYDAARGR